jgi:O-antigen/teichoic acid export membrane protein
VTEQKAKKNLTNNVISLTVVQIATYILPLISVPVVSRIIGPEKYGIINFSAAFITYFTMVISYSFDFSATRKLARDPDNATTRNTVFSEVFFTQVLLFCISTIAFVILLLSVEKLQANLTIILFSYMLCVSLVFTHNWLYQAMQDLSKVAIFNLASRLLFTVSVLMVVRNHDDYIWQPFLIGMIQTVIALCSFFWAIKKYKLTFIRIPFKRCLDVLWEEKTVFLSLVFVNIYSYSNIVFLGFYQSQEQVGYFTAAQRLIVIAQSVLTMPLAQAFYPYVGKAFGQSREDGLRVAQKLIPFIIAFVGLASFAMFLIGPLLIPMFYGNKFQAAIPVFQILSISPLFYALNNVLGVQIMLNLGMDSHFFKICVASAIVNIALNLILIRHLGFMGSTINCVVNEMFIFGSTLYILIKNGINPINREYFKVSLLLEYLEPLKKRLAPTKVVR